MNNQSKKEIQKKCKICGKQFFIYKYILKTGRGKFCSRKCFYKSPEHHQEYRKDYKKISKFNCICKNCEKEFHVVPSRLKYTNVTFCSTKCCAIARQKKVEWVCVCGKKYYLIPSVANRHGKFCSVKCRSKYIVPKKYPLFQNLTKEEIETKKQKEREYKKEYWKTYYTEDKKINHRKHALKYEKKMRKNPQYRLNGNMRKSISKSLRGTKNKKHWENIVCYNIEKLKKHLEKQFTVGMNWDNYGKWHIDHIKPVVSFKFEKIEDIDFKRCWALSNLQPLWASDNRRKNDKLNWGL